jgi:ectoine hydroxylase
MRQEEIESYRNHGYVMQHDVLAEPELQALRDAAERVEQRVREDTREPETREAFELPDGHRLQFWSGTAIQWEWQADSEEIRLIEPIDHLDPCFSELFEHPHLQDTAARMLEVERVGPFTSKLNFKRAREGSHFPWHQDFPYWYVRIEGQAQDVVTAMLLLDDADAENGALRVLPGSHLAGPARRDPQDPLRSLADPAHLDESGEVMMEAAAGSVLWFGSLLLHRSAPNLSGRDRRALLYSFQPEGRRHYRDTPFHPKLVQQLP